jgi:hypothetical protein
VRVHGDVARRMSRSDSGPLTSTYRRSVGSTTQRSEHYCELCDVGQAEELLGPSIMPALVV